MEDTSFTVDSRITINWAHNRPTSAKDMVKRINFIIDNYSGVIRQKGTIFYIYVMTALHAKHSIRGDYAIYDGMIKGLFSFPYPLPTIDNKIELSMNFSDTEFNPDITIFYDLLVKKSRRKGSKFETNFTEGNRSRLTEKQVVRLLKEHYDIPAHLDGDMVKISDTFL